MDDASNLHGPADTLRTLASAALRGDDAAFEQIYARLDGGLRRFFARRAGNRPELIEELSQRSWVGLWQALRQGRYDPERAAVTTFLYAIGYKHWLQHRREARSAAGQLNTDDDFIAELLVNSDDAGDSLHVAELLDAFRQCVGQTRSPQGLSAEERQIVLGVGLGLSERALAAQLGLAASTINAHKKAAYEKLRQCLWHKGFTDESAERGQPPGE